MSSIDGSFSSDDLLEAPDFEAPLPDSYRSSEQQSDSWANDDLDFLSDSTNQQNSYDDESSYDLEQGYKFRYAIDEEEEDAVVSPRTTGDVKKKKKKKPPKPPPKSHPEQQRARKWTRGDLESSVDRASQQQQQRESAGSLTDAMLDDFMKSEPPVKQQEAKSQGAAGVGNLSLDAWASPSEPQQKNGSKKETRKKSNTLKSPRKIGKSPRPGNTDVTRTAGGGLRGWVYKQKAAGRFDLKGKGWKNRFCVYDPKKQRLVYYHYEGEKNHANFISLDSETRISILEGVSPSSDIPSFAFQIDTSYTHRPYVFCVETQEALDTWMVGLEEAVVAIMSDESAEVNVEKVFRSYETSRSNTARNYPVVDLMIIKGQSNLTAEYFAACYATGDQKFRTWAAPNSKSPEWNCDGTFMNKKEDISTIKVKMFSRSNLGDRCVGKTEIDISSFNELEVIEKWYELKSRKRGLQAKVLIRIQRCTALAPQSINASWGVPTTVLPLRVDSGDIILFGNSNFVAQGTKMFTRSQWDHVAIVLRWSNNELKLFEATGSGVGLYKLGPRLEVLHSDTKMAIRRLVVSDRTREMIQSLHQFIEKMRGRHYKKRLGVIVKAAVSDQKKAGPDEEDLSSVFCSELVVAAFQRMNLVSDKFSAKGFLPKDLADKDNLAMPLEGATLERKRIFSRRKDRHMDGK